MKKYHVLVMFSLLCLPMQAQKVKIKKGIISVENVEAAQVKKLQNKATKQKSFVFYDLQQQDSVVFKAYELQPRDYYFGIHASFATDTADMKMEAVVFTMNEEKALTELLVKKHKFITPQGLEKETIKSYISSQNERLIPKELARLEKMKSMEKVVAALNLKVTSNWNITSRDFVVGKVDNATAKTGWQGGPTFVDREGKPFASVGIDAGQALSKYSNLTMGGDTREIETSVSFIDDDRTTYLTEVLHFIALNGFLPVSMTLDGKTLAGESALVYGQLNVKDHQPLFGFFSPSFLQNDPKKDFGKNDYVYAYASENRSADQDDVQTVFFGGYEKIDAADCDVLIATFDFDENAKPVRVDEGYAPVSFTKKYNKAGKQSGAKSGVKLGKLLAPKNYVALYAYDDMYVLSHEWKNKWTVARDYFLKEDLLEFAKDYPDMVSKIEADNDYLDGVEGLKKFIKDFDDAIIASLSANDDE